jgi:hypothetical protein
MSGSASPIPAARPVIDEADIEAAVRVLRSGMVVQGLEFVRTVHDGRRSAQVLEQWLDGTGAVDPDNTSTQSEQVNQ